MASARQRALILLACGLFVAPVAWAEAPPDFDGFCASWMAKLRAREADNARAAVIVQRDAGYVGEFTGYGRKPLFCTVQRSGGTAASWIGQLVYEEIAYRQTGTSAKAARSSAPQATGRTPVMEIFRFDGVKWVW